MLEKGMLSTNRGSREGTSEKCQSRQELKCWLLKIQQRNGTVPVSESSEKVQLYQTAKGKDGLPRQLRAKEAPVSVYRRVQS
jgi:hypothetical protein